jgi:hypothetical protein
MKVFRVAHDAVACYKVIYDKKKKVTTQSPLDKYLYESEKDQVPLTYAESGPKLMQ